MKTVSSVHIIGVGGIGTSAVAKWWKHQGARVTGSDMHPSVIVDGLEAAGVKVKIGHFADNVPGDCELVVYSSAVPATNVERQAAAERGIEMMSYPEFLGALSKEHKTIAVSGTNGKSTTTAMIAKILIDADLDPTVILGTMSPDLPEGNLRVGKSEWLVIEACEHMGHMLEVKPQIAVITNIEEDHLDYYRDIDHIRETFQKWIDCEDTCSNIVLNKQDEQSQKLTAKYVDYFDVENRNVGDGVQTFDVAGVEVSLKIPGAFNAQNAAAALTVAHLAGVADDTAVASLAQFAGTWRRFEHVGVFNGATVFSDYAHHPTAIAGALAAYKEFFPEKRLVLVFEPHQYSRTAELFDGFVTCFSSADVLILSEVYEVAGRNEFAGKTSKDLAEAVKDVSEVHYAQDLEKAESLVRDVVQENDVIVIMGAGDVDRIARNLTS